MTDIRSDECLSSLIVPKDKYLKIANNGYKCRGCGHQSNKTKNYFLSLITLNQTDKNLMSSGFYVKSYGLGIHGAYKDEDGFDPTEYTLNHNDWGGWNAQIASIIVADIETSTHKLDIWVDAFFKGSPYTYPGRKEFTFNNVMRMSNIYLTEHGLNLQKLKDLLTAIRTHNSAWAALLDSHVNAAPVDLKDPLVLSLYKTKSLADLFPGEIYV